MKRLIYIIVSSLFIISCSVEDDKSFNLEMVPVSYVEMPTAFRVDSVTKIPVHYNRPTSCHEFSNFYYNSLGNERTVAIYCSKISNSNCEPSTGDVYPLEVPLNFKPKTVGIYKFRFWAGVDSEGVDQYIEHEILVNH